MTEHDEVPEAFDEIRERVVRNVTARIRSAPPRRAPGLMTMFAHASVPLLAAAAAIIVVSLMMRDASPVGDEPLTVADAMSPPAVARYVARGEVAPWNWISAYEGAGR